MAAGAGAVIALACDLRVAAESAKLAFLFVRVGLAGADMGACALLPRIIGQGRASELLYTGRFMDGVEAERWGFYNSVAEPDAVLKTATTLAQTLAAGPTIAHAITKRSLHDEWDMGVDEAIAAEAKAQAICMDTKDFTRGYRAFLEKRAPKFEGD